MKVDHLDVVQRLHLQSPPLSGEFPGGPDFNQRLQSCFQFQQRLLAELARLFPSERWGYLKKGGENTIQFQGETVKVGRICGPDSQLYKILTDIPTANDPQWDDDGILTNDFPGTKPEQWWMPFEGAVPIPDPGPNPTPTPIGLDLTPVLNMVQAVLVQVNIQANLISAMGTRLEALFTDMQARTNELKAIAQQPQHYEGSARVLGASTKITLDKVYPKADGGNGD